MTASTSVSADATPHAASEGRLPRRLGTWSTAAVTVGIMIGSGIFRVPAEAAAQTGSAEAMLLVWVVGGIVAMCGALALAEVAALFPNAGGMYVYLREAYGPLTAFLFGWLYLVIIPTGAGAIALVFAEYLGRLVPIASSHVRLVAQGERQSAGMLMSTKCVPLSGSLGRRPGATSSRLPPCARRD